MLAVLIGGELFVEVFLGELRTPFLLRTEALGYGEKRHDGAVIDGVDLHLVEYLTGVAERFGDIGEDVVHLLLRLEPFLLGVAQTVGVVKILTRGDAKQVVVSLGGVLVLEVAVVGADELYAIFARELYEDLVGFLLQGKSLAVGDNVGIFDLMALQLEIVVVAKDAVIPLYGFTGTVDVTFQNLGRHLAGDAGGADDQILVIFLKVVTVGARPGVETVYPGVADELDEVLVSMIVLGKDDEVVALIVTFAPVLTLLVVIGDVHLATEDRLERLLALLLALLVDACTIIGKFLDAVHHAVVGDGHALHAVGNGFVHQVVYF